MIKKLLSTFLFIASVGISSSFAQAAVCTPDFTCLPGGATEGICPDSTMGLPAGTISVAYSTNISIKIPSSTTSGSSTYTLSHLAVTDVLVDSANTGTYVPLTTIGLDYLGSGTNSPVSASGISGYTMTKYCYWSAPSSACVIMSGTPNASGSFPLRIKSQARVDPSGLGFYVWIAAPDNNQYHLVVNAASGVATIEANKFEVEQNNPNPFFDNTEIRFTSGHNSTDQFKVFNILGKMVYTNQVKAEIGLNTVKFSASSLSPGVYFYEITDGDKTITKKMIVAGK